MEALKPIRIARKMSQAALGAAVNKSQSSVAMWESGANFPEVETLMKMADVLRCTTDELLGRKPFSP